MKKIVPHAIAGLLLMTLMMLPSSAFAACAKVSLEILQTLTLERVAFDAKLVLTNNVPDTALEELRLDIVIRNNAGEAKDTLFFVRKPVLSGVNALDGTGTVAAGGKAEAHWLIIPSPGAGVVVENGVVTQSGVDYWVGATLTYTVAGKQEVVPINPDKITVKPMPQLVLDYFMPYDVIGDNPFTKTVEPAVPFPVALRVMNDGYGPAMKLKIDSAQPRITQNDQGLLIDFKLLGASVNDSPVDPTLTVNFGDLLSKKAATAYWQMISTLTGRFTEFKAEFSHSSELGGELTSLIRETNPHYLTHMIKVNLPGRDSRLDFLAHTDPTDKDLEHLPDAIYESEIPTGSTDMTQARSTVSVLLPVAAPARPTPEAPSVQLELSGGKTGWIYTKLDDPAAGLLKLLDVVRSDGVHLDPHNFWVDEGVDKSFNTTHTLQFVDYRADDTVPLTYTVTYAKPDIDTTPPVSALIFDGPVSGSGPYYLPLETRVVLTAKDNEGGSGVSGIYKRINGEDELFQAAYPFNFEAAGNYTLEFYSADRAGNVEPTRSAQFVAVSAPPVISSFSVTPQVFAPQTPAGVVAARSVEFAVKAASAVPSVQVEVAIAAGNEFQQANVVRTLKGEIASGSELKFSWDGKDSTGKIVASGPYAARALVSDGLEDRLNPAPHTATATGKVTAADWFQAAPLDPNPAADQLHPRISGKRVVWQDQRNGNWDIYFKDASGGEAKRLTSDGADQQWPAIDGNIVVWQDNRSGNWDIYGMDLSSGSEFVICGEAGDQQRPVVAGNWVSWQDNRAGNWDIYAYNLSTKETVRLTTHERDQMHPAISGNSVVWEDYRHGTGEVYSYDLALRTENRVTFDPQNQSSPAVSGSTLTWVDERNGERDIYSYTPARGTLRITYGSADHTQAAVSGDTLVYTDFEAGADDPNLSYRVLTTGAGGRLTNDPAIQEEPTLGDKLVAWQDTRNGKYQIFTAPLELEALPVQAELRPGMNLVAAGGSLATQYPTAAALLAAKGSELGIERLLAHDPLHNSYVEAAPGSGDFPLSKGMGLVLYAGKKGTLTLADAGDRASYTLLPGMNQIGILTVPYGYTASEMVKSLGADNVEGIRRHDPVTGSWQTLSLRATTGGSETVGTDFVISQGEALVVKMKNRVDNWAP